jgi:hypoxanthine phosphoribosyltransferase
MPSDIRTLFNAAKIAARVRELGARIHEDYAADEPLVLVCVLKGSFVFAADLARAIDRRCSIEFLGVRSYGDGTESSGVVEITHDLACSIEGKHVLIVEDIVDTGLTMQYLLSNFATRKPASVKVAALLHKPARERVQVAIEYLGFTIEDVFVVGYGMDAAQEHRNLPFVGILDTDT